MPLWSIHHSPGVFTQAEKKGLAEAITDRYAAIGLPRFYVVVIFAESPSADFYVGGNETPLGVRVVIDHIARQHPDSASRRRSARWIRDMIAPFTERHEGLHWEFHVNEANEELWMVDGMVPPPGGSAAEKSWAEANAPVPY